MPEALPFIGAGISGISALGGLLGGNNSPPPPPPSYQPQNLGGADQGAFAGINSLPGYNTAAQTLPYSQNTFQSLYNNPYAGGYQGGANAIAPWATGAGGQQFGAGTNMIGAGQSYLPYAQQALQTGFDPQQALYHQLFQQNTDQTRAGEAARGISMSPYGAGVENQSNLNFNNQWLNQLLGRQATAAGTANTLTGAAGQAGTTGAGLQQGGLNTMLQGASLPYSTANTIGGNQNQAIGAYSGAGAAAGGQAQQQIADYLQYLGIGNQSAQVANSAYSNQLTAQNQQFNQGQTLGKNLGSAFSGLGQAWNGGGGNAYFQGNPYQNMPRIGSGW